MLCVAEKPAIAGSIARVLARGDRARDADGGGDRDGDGGSRGRGIPTHRFTADFEGRAADFVVTSVRGHVFSTDFPSEYNSWDAVDPLDLFRAPVVKQPEGKGGVVRHLADCGRGVDVLLLWLDCDAEGENICFEVLECVRPKASRSLRVLRAHFSAVASADIQRAMRSLTAPDENLSLAVDARQELDLKVGVAFTRFQTRYFQGKYGNLESGVVSYGPCQTPTLGFVVDRHDLIQTFQPEPFYVVEASVERGGRTLTVEWERGRVFSLEVARMFETMVSDASVVRVASVKVSEARRGRPTPMNTVEMLKAASRTLGMGPAQTMHIAEDLYLSGYLSYPRTESTRYPDSFDVRGLLASQASNPSWGEHVRGLLADGISRPTSGVDAGDHPPITPVRPLHGAGGDRGRLYDLVCRHFIATVSGDCRYIATKVRLEAAGEVFTLSGREVTDPGFTAVLTSGIVEDEPLPEFSEGETLRLASLRVREGKTSPPGYLTEAELIGLMERNGIGTDASIPTHVNNIIVRNYVTLGSGRTLVPTQLGIVLVVSSVSDRSKPLRLTACHPALMCSTAITQSTMTSSRRKCAHRLRHNVNSSRRAKRESPTS